MPGRVTWRRNSDGEAGVVPVEPMRSHVALSLDVLQMNELIHVLTISRQALTKHYQVAFMPQAINPNAVYFHNTACTTGTRN